MKCGVCGERYCALVATSNAAALADWRATHTLRAVLENPMTDEATDPSAGSGRA